MDEAHGKLGWYHERYQEANKIEKSLQAQLDAEKEHRCKAKSELHLLQKEEKTKGKQREIPAPHNWHEWESTSDSEITEW